MRKRQWLIAGTAAAAALAASGATALAAEPPTVTPHRTTYGSFITDTEAWPDRAGDSWYCSFFDIGCSDPQRPLGPGDVPVASLAGGRTAAVACYRGSYYLTAYNDTGNVAWVVNQAVAIPPTEPGPQQCSAIDDPN
jgi:hypothetical protein